MDTDLTFNGCKQIFLNSAQSDIASINNDISALSLFDDLGNTVGGVGSSLALEQVRLFNNTIPQYSDEFGINTQLASAALAPQLPAQPAQMTLTPTPSLTVGKVYDLPVGTIVTADNGNTYTVIASDITNYVNTIPLSTINPNFLVISNIKGQGYLLPTDSILTLTPPIVSTDNIDSFSQVKVVDLSTNHDGTNAESLASATNRLITAKQIPLNGTRLTDFQDIILQNFGVPPNTTVTGVIILNSNQVTYAPPSIANFGIYLASGDPINNAILDQGLITGTTTQLYTRNTNSTIIDNVKNFLYLQEIIGARPAVNSVATQPLTGNADPDKAFFRITVKLQKGYSKTQIVQIGNSSYTIEQLIQREVRRAVCGQNFGATLAQDIDTYAYTSSTLQISDIENQLDATLGTANSTGTLGAYLINRVVEVYNYTDDKYNYVPIIDLTLGIPTTDIPSATLDWVYDISITPADIYPNIKVAT